MIPGSFFRRLEVQGPALIDKLKVNESFRRVESLIGELKVLVEELKVRKYFLDELQISVTF